MPLRSFRLSPQRPDGRRSAGPSDSPGDAHPGVPVIWCHAAGHERACALRDLAERLIAQRPDIPVLLTFDQRTMPSPDRNGEFGPSDPLIAIEALDHDHPMAAANFFLHWRPAVGLWTGMRFMRNYLKAAQTARVPMLLADAQERDLDRDNRGWLPDPQRAALQVFEHVFAIDLATSARFQRLGVPHSRIQVAPRLADGIMPPPCDEELLAATGDMLAGRSIWFAADMCAGEADILITAHRHAVRLAHRLLLVVTPAGPGDAIALRRRLEGSGLRFADWVEGNLIDEFTQVLIVEEAWNQPFWLRLSPVTLMGGTLVPDGDSRAAPLLSAALGSAVLHGPHTGKHAAAYRRLTPSGGSRMVSGAEDLGEAVLQLSQPDQAAAMALAGWEAVTRGAWLTDHLIELLQDLYDTNDSAHARA